MGSLAGAMADDYTVIQRIGVPAASDQELLDLLRQGTALYEAEKLARGVDRLPVNTHLAELDPSELPSCFLMSGELRKTMEIHQRNESWGYKTGSFSAIRGPAPPTPRPQYIGVKKRMEFRERNGAKSDWVMIQYHLLEPKNEGRDLFLQDELMLCVVSRLKNKAEVLSPDQAICPQISNHLDYVFTTFRPDEFDRDGPLSSVLEEQLDRLIGLLSECFNSENQRHGVGLQPNTKRPRSTGTDGKSDVWRDFTRIHVKDEHDKFKLAYAACHICDKLLKAPSRNGTKTLWRHNETCSCKQVKQQSHL